MKIKKINSKLILNKKTVSNLNSRDMLSIQGGVKETDPFWCMTNGCTFGESDWESCYFSCSRYCSLGPC